MPKTLEWSAEDDNLGSQVGTIVEPAEAEPSMVDSDCTIVEESPRNSPPGSPISQGEKRPAEQECAIGDRESSKRSKSGGLPSLVYVALGGLQGFIGNDARTVCLRCDLAPKFGRDNATRVFCHTVYVPNTGGQHPHAVDRCVDVARNLQLRTTEKLDNWIVAVHDKQSKNSGRDLSHIHLIHCCTTYQSHRTCRCLVINSIRPAGFTFKRKYFTSTDNQRHLEEVVLYLSEGGRTIYSLCSANRTYGRLVGAQDDAVPSCGCQFESFTGHARYNRGQFRGTLLGVEPYEELEETDGSEPGYSGANRELSANWKVNLGRKTAALILELMPNSIEKLRECEKFSAKGSDFESLYWDSALYNSLVPIAWQEAVKEWNRLSLREIIERRAKHPSTFLDTKTYYGPKYSAHLLSRLILEQSMIKEDAIQFVDNLIAIIDKTEPKVNSFCLISPPSAGKTFLFNSLTTLLWNTGRIRNSKKGGDSFTYQDGVNTRLNEWNECVLHGKEAVDDAKGVWEGNDQAVNVKYAKGSILTRTPLLVAANALPWSHIPHEAKTFMDRCFLYTWRSQPWLKTVHHYPCPLAWKIILDHYKTDEWWDTLPDKCHFNDEDDELEAMRQGNYTYMFETWLTVKRMEKDTLDTL